MPRLSENSYRVYGDKGYPEISPSKMWYVETIWHGMYSEYGHVPFYTAIYPFHDDPNYEFKTLEKYPELTQSQLNDLNAPHTKLWRGRRAIATSYSKDFQQLYDRIEDIYRMWDVYIARYLYPNEKYTGKYGGYIPHNGRPIQEDTQT